MAKKFFRDAAFLSMIEIIVKLKGVIILPILTKYLGAESFGIWSQTAVVASTISPLIVLGTDSAVIRYLPGISDEQQKRHFSAWALVVLLAASLAGLLLCAVPSISSAIFYGRKDLAAFVLLASLMLIMTLSLNCLRNWFRIRNLARSYGGISVAQAAVSLSALLLGVYQHADLFRLMLYVVLADAAVGVIYLMWIFKTTGLAAPDFSVMKKFFRYGLPLVPAGFAMWGLGYMDRLFLVHMGSLHEIGIYSLVYQIGYFALQLLINPIWTMYATTAAEAYNNGRHDDVQKLFNQSVGVILLITLPAVVGLFVLGRDVLPLLSSTEFLNGAPIMAIVAFAYLLHMISAYYDTSLTLAHRQGLTTISACVACGVNFIANALLIPYFSILGAALATVFGFSAQLLFSWYMAHKYRLIHTDLRYPARVVLAATLMGVILFFLVPLMPAGIVSLIAKIVAGIAIYYLLATILRLLPKDLHTQVWGVLRR